RGLDLPPARPARGRGPRRHASRGERRRPAAQVLPDVDERSARSRRGSAGLARGPRRGRLGAGGDRSGGSVMTAFGGGVMTAFVGECRQEWKRLGVPDGLAEEMAAELESDLAEAEADGVSAAELLGESDPRRFAATWARERGLVSEPSPQKRRRRVWPWVVLAVFLLVVGGSVTLALSTFGAGS